MAEYGAMFWIVSNPAFLSMNEKIKFDIKDGNLLHHLIILMQFAVTCINSANLQPEHANMLKRLCYYHLSILFKQKGSI